MENNNQDLQAQIDKLNKNYEDLTKEIYKNNFSASQDFNKTSNFTTRLKIPHYTSLPPICDIGELVEVGGILYIGSGINKFSKVGSQ